jgi:hypothetical protein
MESSRYHVTLAFWVWAYEHNISGNEIARTTGYSPAYVHEVRRNARLTVSQRFVDVVCASYLLPPDGDFFLRVAVTSRRHYGDALSERQTVTTEGP